MLLSTKTVKYKKKIHTKYRVEKGFKLTTIIILMFKNSLVTIFNVTYYIKCCQKKKTITNSTRIIKDTVVRVNRKLIKYKKWA